jgi:hypothetical protein
MPDKLHKIVRERLRTSSVPEVHPDADLLTAFSEQSLVGTERATVMEHLAHCGVCREVVALAQPEEIIAQIVASVEPSENWFRLPLMRWGLVAAGLVAVVSVGALQYQKSHQSKTVAAYVRSRPEVTAAQAPAPASNQKPSDASLAQEQEKDKAAAESANAASRTSSNLKSGQDQSTGRSLIQLNPPAAGKSVAPGAGSGYGNAPRATLALGTPVPALDEPAAKRRDSAPPPEKLTNQEAKAGRAAIPAPSEVVEVQTAQAQVQTQSGDQLQPSAPVAAAQPMQATREEQVARAKSAEVGASVQASGSVQALAAPAGAAGSLSKSMVKSAPATQPRWTVTSSGGLLRSYDGGNTWQAVSVGAAADREPANEASSVKARGATAEWQTTPVFRSVFAAGSEVWAGGSAGALCHSLDAGQHWVRVIPSAAGTLLSGDIISVVFSDSQHGKLATGDAETWTTADDGQSWQKH